MNGRETNFAEEEGCIYHQDKPLCFVQPFKERNSTWVWLKLLRKELRWLGNQKEAQKIFFLIAINLTGTILLLIWCRITSSIALLAYTYLSWFNFLSLLTCLLCVWVEAQVATYTFTFGLVRCEVLAVFSSVTLTLLGALFIFKESIERLIQPEEVQVDQLSSMALVGFILNLSMTGFIHNHPLNHVLRSSPSSVLQEHFADMCHSFCMQMPRLKRLLLPRVNPLVLISFTGFAFIIGDHIIVQVYNYPRGDTVAAIAIALFTITTMYPLCICSANLLLQTIPSHYLAHLDKCLREALTLDGVLEFHAENFWVLGVGFRSGVKRNGASSFLEEWSGSIVVGSLHVRIRREANEQLVLKHVTDRLKPLVPLLTVQVFKDDWKRSSTTIQLLNDSVLSLCGIPFQTKYNQIPPQSHQTESKSSYYKKTNLPQKPRDNLSLLNLSLFEPKEDFTSHCPPPLVRSNIHPYPLTLGPTLTSSNLHPNPLTPGPSPYSSNYELNKDFNGKNSYETKHRRETNHFDNFKDKFSLPSSDVSRKINNYYPNGNLSFEIAPNRNIHLGNGVLNSHDFHNGAL